MMMRQFSVVSARGGGATGAVVLTTQFPVTGEGTDQRDSVLLLFL